MQSRKITGPRKAILDILRKHPHPLTNREVLAAMPGSQCDLATIYRAMHLLEELGMVKQFDFGDGIARFELLGEGGKATTTTSSAPVVRGWSKSRNVSPRELKSESPRENGFKAVTHKLEFFGLCPDCQ